MDEVLDEAGRLAPGGVVVEVHPGVVVPHGGRTGFTYGKKITDHMHTLKQTKKVPLIKVSITADDASAASLWEIVASC